VLTQPPQAFPRAPEPEYALSLRWFWLFVAIEVLLVVVLAATS
jgi:hypothetical protein